MTDDSHRSPPVTRRELLGTATLALTGSAGCITFSGGSSEDDDWEPDPDRLRWRFWVDGRAASSPLVDDNGILYIGSTDGSLYALDASTGEPQWEFETADSVWSPPLLDTGTIYIGSNDNTLSTLTGLKSGVFERMTRYMEPPR